MAIWNSSTHGRVTAENPDALAKKVAKLLGCKPADLLRTKPSPRLYGGKLMKQQREKQKQQKMQQTKKQTAKKPAEKPQKGKGGKKKRKAAPRHETEETARVKGLGFRVWGLGFRLGFRV